VLVGEGVVSEVYEKPKSGGGRRGFYVTETTWRGERSGKPVVRSRGTLAINCKPGADEAKPLA